MSYPTNSIKGIANNDFLEDGHVGANLFYFNKDDHTRDDGRVEQSINWEDDKTAIDFSLSQKKDDEGLQFKAGVAIVPLSEIDRLRRNPNIMGLLSYERSPLTDNPYHGNLLLKADVPKRIMRKIAAGLALAVSEIIPAKCLPI